MEPKTKVFRTHRVLAWLYGIIGSGVIAFAAISSGKLDPSGAVAVLLVFGLLAAGHMAIAKACLAGKRWGRIASIVVACLMLAAFPLGTIIGIYLLGHCWKPWAETPTPGTPAPTVPPRTP
ncbi:hypothetical protein BurJ1DRAFT_2977 [Burkholderiales bacterium JOSHI_001]|nr:hypothetical protein BurJ1DRAFT_2977 [Burkholderiales bacterium JOSHI_001]